MFKNKFNVVNIYKGMTVSLLIYFLGYIVCRITMDYIFLGKVIEGNSLKLDSLFTFFISYAFYVITIPLVVFLFMIVMIIELRNYVSYRIELLILFLMTIALIIISMMYSQDVQNMHFFISNIIPLYLGGVYYLSIQEHRHRQEKKRLNQCPDLSIAIQSKSRYNGDSRESKESNTLITLIKSLWDFDK